MPGSMESTSPDQRTVRVPPRLAGVFVAAVSVCCAPPQPAAKSAAATDAEIKDLERAITSTDRLKWLLLDWTSGAQQRECVLEGVLAGRTNEWVVAGEARVAVRLAPAADRFVDALER